MIGASSYNVTPATTCSPATTYGGGSTYAPATTYVVATTYDAATTYVAPSTYAATAPAVSYSAPTTYAAPTYSSPAVFSASYATPTSVSYAAPVVSYGYTPSLATSSMVVMPATTAPTTTPAKLATTPAKPATKLAAQAMDVAASNDAGMIAVVVTTLSGRSQRFTVSADSTLHSFRKSVAEAFSFKVGSVKLILGSTTFTFAQDDAKLSELSIEAGAELTLVQQSIMDVVEGARLRVSEAGSDFVNGTYVAVRDPRGAYGSDYGDISFRRLGEENFPIGQVSTSISWYNSICAWPAAWYIEQGKSGIPHGVYYMVSDDQTSLVLAGWQVYRGDAALLAMRLGQPCASGDEPVPCLAAD